MIQAVSGYTTAGNRVVTFSYASLTVGNLSGYSYVLDTSPDTLPDASVDTMGTSLTLPLLEDGLHYFHIRTISANGVAGETVHLALDQPYLTGEQGESDEMPTVSLHWSLSDEAEKLYKLYQKTETASEFSSISLTDLSSDSTQVRVLNLYPYNTSWLIPSGAKPSGTVTFTTYKGQTYTLPKMASLKQWMEEPTTHFPKGYGMGIIEVTPVKLSDFNKNPSSYLFQADGTYAYDVISIGAWDYNGSTGLTAQSLSFVKTFVDEGYGLMLGHDSLNADSYADYTNELRDYVNIKTGTDLSASGYSGLSQTLTIKRKGLLTEYPHQIGTVGDRLTVPTTHSVQFACGDIWIAFEGLSSEREIGGCTNNFYLTAKDNVSMVQTGHSQGAATSDEQKLLANVLFYLNQLSTETSFTDYSPRDMAAPTTPTEIEVEQAPFGGLSISFQASLDRGTTYDYYVESQTKDGTTSLVSNRLSTTIESGIAGYSYVVDTSPNSTPDDFINTTETQLFIPNLPASTAYLHLKAIDEAGNASDVFHYEIQDIYPPYLRLSVDSDRFTTQTVNLGIEAYDGESGIYSYRLPSGSYIYPLSPYVPISAHYIVPASGDYSVTVTDLGGNQTQQVESITHISDEGETDSLVTLTYRRLSEQGEGLTDWMPVKDGETLLQTMEANERVEACAQDLVGKGSCTSTWVKIDKTTPIIHFAITKEPEYLRATLNLNIIEEGGSGIQDLHYTLDGGANWISIWGDNFTIYGNHQNPSVVGQIRVTDKAGNVGYTSFEIVFDVTGPTVNLLGENTTWTNQSVTITAIVSDESGIKGYTLPNGETIQLSDSPKTLTITYEAPEVSQYFFIFEDIAGNRTYDSIFIDYIDKSAPNVGVFNYSGETWVSSSVTVQIVGSN